MWRFGEDPNKIHLDSISSFCLLISKYILENIYTWREQIAMNRKTAKWTGKLLKCFSHLYVAGKEAHNDTSTKSGASEVDLISEGDLCLSLKLFKIYNSPLDTCFTGKSSHLADNVDSALAKCSLYLQQKICAYFCRHLYVSSCHLVCTFMKHPHNWSW